MKIKDRALYNLLRINWLEDLAMKVKPWQVEDYRLAATDVLFKRLKVLGISLNERAFVDYAENCESPEELAAVLWVAEEEGELYDQAYLLIFELWRRLLPDKRCLSVFCDELDRKIEEYDHGSLEDEDAMAELLKELEDVLDDSVDEGMEAKQAFESVASYCAHDLENFLYDYISEQIDVGNETTASELIDGFYDYIGDSKWFDFLRVRLFLATDPEDGNLLLRRLFETLEEAPDFLLLLEIVRFLAHTGEPAQFSEAMQTALLQARTEQDFQDLIALAIEYHRLLDNEKEAKHFAGILKKRAAHPKDQRLMKSDPGFKGFLEVVLKLEIN